MAEVKPAPIAMARNDEFNPLRFGNPKLKFDAPHVVLTPNSSRRRRMIDKAWHPA
jgi:hypothetical protein